LSQVFVSNVFASIGPMLDAGHWMLDLIRNFSFLIYPESSIQKPASLRIKQGVIYTANLS
jgi:hypothetical protein